LYARLTAAAYQKLVSDEIPPSLEVGKMQLVQIKQNVTRVCTYSSFDPLDLPGVVMQVLGYFDGRPTAEALAAIADEKEIRLDPSLVRKMVDFALLVPPKP